MRLLRMTGNGKLEFTKDWNGSQTPAYVILSHTWGAEEEEVTYQDILKGTGKSKSGYEKIELCGRQAERNGFQYFWVDTCCINKESSAELSEAINSMYRWCEIP